MRTATGAVILAFAGLAACTPRESAPTPAPAAAPVTAAPAAAPAATLPPAAGVPATGGAPAIASQDSKWSGVVFEVVEFRRRGNTLTAKVRVANRGTAEMEPDIMWAEAYLMDAAAGKKYEALKDEKGTFIAANRQGYSYRWYEKMAPGQTATIWVKFPAPPPDVKAVTFTLPGVPPFEDLAIQDS